MATHTVQGLLINLSALYLQTLPRLYTLAVVAKSGCIQVDDDYRGKDGKAFRPSSIILLLYSTLPYTYQLVLPFVKKFKKKKKKKKEKKKK